MGRLKGSKLTEEHKRKIGLASKGRKMSKEWKAKLIKRLKGNKFWLGKHHKEETKIKISLAHQGKKFTLKHRKNMSIARKKLFKINPNMLLGSNHPQWKGGKTTDGHNYILIHQFNHPHHVHQNYVYEHTLIVEKYLGRYLQATEECHHLNSNHSDNRPQNLMAFINHSAHRRFEEKKQEVKPEEIIFDGRKMEGNMKIHTKEIAEKILKNNLLDISGYSLQSLFKMRDALYILDVYGKADLDLLREVEKWIIQEVE